MQYGWSLMSGGANHSRLTSITYPNGKVLNYTYNSGLDDSLSRLSSLSDTSGTLESYAYLGLGTVVKRAHPQPGVDLTYIKQSGESNGDAGDQYTGLDRFGRVVDQRWIVTASGSHTDRFQYGYDRDSNRLYRDNLVNSAFGELYHANGSSNGYDNLNQLQAFARGTLNGTKDTISSPSHSQSWSFDAAGNWSSLTTDGTGVNRTHNKQNEVTGVGSNTLTFDANGNLTKDDAGQQYVYDAWNRLVAVKNSGGTTIASYKYDGIHRRIVENTGTANDLYYSDQWQVLEERLGGVSTATVQYVWSPVYVDALVLRDRSTANNGTLDERLWVQQDANWNVTALINGSGTVVERYVYDAYGKPTFLSASWGTLSGSAYAWIYLFQGKRYSTITNLYYSRLRDYSPTLGRWLQTDPLEFRAGDVNVYRAEANSPLSHGDPSGLIGLLILWACCPDFTYWQVSQLHDLTGGVSTDILTSQVFGDALDTTDQFFAGWSNMLLFGFGVYVREFIYGETATRNHGGDAFEIGQLVGFIHMILMAEVGVPPAEAVGPAELRLAPDNPRPIPTALEAEARPTAPQAQGLLPAPGQVLNRNGVPYPNIIDPRTGRAIPFPETIVRTPPASRAPWGPAERRAFIAEWERRGFSEPLGGWENYDIHHIQPREWGGTNAFENLVPVQRGVHQQTVTPWWNNFSGR